MMGWTDRHCRYFLRQISRHCRLYTEMVTTGALLQGDPERALRFSTAEHPVALQLGGSDPEALAQAARIGAGYGYDEINLNLGCPSDRVRSGRFGACLMAEPQLVGDCMAAMQGAVSLPVSVKLRIGIDDQDSYEHLARFTATLAQAGCRTFIVHARKAILGGLSPKENRTIPPLQYDMVYRLKRDFPALEIILNGGIASLDDAARHLGHVDGVMLGRAAYHNPWILAQAEQRFFPTAHPPAAREQVIERMLPYIETELERGTALKHITRHLLGLYRGVAGAREWRRHLGRNAAPPGAGTEVVRHALDAVNRIGTCDRYKTERLSSCG
jgi:tRNA-dihydrouridine synthase A